MKNTCPPAWGDVLFCSQSTGGAVLSRSSQVRAHAAAKIAEGLYAMDHRVRCKAAGDEERV
jgi:hypothetical protein